MNNLQIVHGEICYRSEEDDQSFGMWCPVSYDTPHNFNEGEYLIPESRLRDLEVELGDALDLINRLERRVSLANEDNDYLHDCVEDLSEDLRKESILRKHHCLALIDIAQEALNMAGKAYHGDRVYVGADPKFAKQSLQSKIDGFKKIYKDTE